MARRFSLTPLARELNDRAYHEESEKTLNLLLDKFYDLEESLPQRIAGFDCEYSSGVLTLKLGVNGSYVINKQPPNKQIWLSSPVSGPKRFNFENNAWRDARTGDRIEQLLTNEIRVLLQCNDFDILAK